MLFLLTLFGCGSDIVCGEGTREVDGECLPNPVLEQTETETETVGACEGASFFQVDVESNVTLVNAKEVDVALYGEDTVSITCALDETTIADEYDYTGYMPAGGEWRYLDFGPYPGDEWFTAEFDDGKWQSGLAPLGYGESGIETTVSYGDDSSDKRITTFFRTTFEYDGSPADSVRITHWVDDGVVLYLNGEELFRYNMPEGDLTLTTSALDTTEPASTNVTFDPALLLEGENLIAARIHQGSSGSSDIYLDLSIELGATADLSGFEETHTMVSETSAPFHTLKFNGLLADARYDCEAVLSCEESTSKPYSFFFTTDPFPDHVPDLQAQTLNAEMASGGYVVYNQQAACGANGQMYFYLADPEGRIRWYYETPDISGSGSIDLEVTYVGDDLFLWGGGEHDATPRLLDVDHSVEYISTYPGAGQEGYHHDVLMTSDGQLMGIVDTDNTAGSSTWTGFGMVRHDMEAHEVTWSWDSQSAVDAGTLQVSNSWNDPYHANSFAEVSDSSGYGFFVSLLYEESIVRVDQASGEILYTIGKNKDFSLIDSDGDPLGDSGWFQGLHSVEANGDRVMLLDNGGSSDGSRVVEYQLDPVNKTAMLVWEWAGEDWYDPTWGDADELPNGNVLVTIANSGCSSHNHAILEVERDTGEIVWRLDTLDGDLSSYRASYIDACDIFANSRFCSKTIE